MVYFLRWVRGCIGESVLIYLFHTKNRLFVCISDLTLHLSYNKHLTSYIYINMIFLIIKLLTKIFFMGTLTKEEYTDLYKTCKEMNIKHIQSLKKVAAFLLPVSFDLGYVAYSSYPHPAWKMPAAVSTACIFLLFFLVFFFMPTAWLKRKIKHFPGMTYQELKRELDSYL